MTDKRGRPNLRPPVDLSNVEWTESTRAWHAITTESRARWARTLCGSRADGAYAYPAADHPNGPPVTHHIPSRVCGRCLDRVTRLAARTTPVGGAS